MTTLELIIIAPVAALVFYLVVAGCQAGRNRK